MTRDKQHFDVTASTFYLHSLRVFAYFTQLTQDRLVWHALTTCLGSLYGPGRPEDTA